MSKDWVYTLQGLLDSYYTQFGEIPKKIVVSKKLYDNMVHSVEPDLRFQGPVAELRYIHRNAEVLFTVEED